MPATTLTPEQIKEVTARLDVLEARLANMEGAKAGAETATADDAKTFARFAKQLKNPHFAKTFHASRKHTALAIRRMGANLPQRRLA